MECSGCILTVCVGSDVQLPAVNFRATACARSMELFFLEGIFPFSILDFEFRKMFWQFLVFLVPPLKNIMYFLCFLALLNRNHFQNVALVCSFAIIPSNHYLFCIF